MLDNRDVGNGLRDHVVSINFAENTENKYNLIQ